MPRKSREDWKIYKNVFDNFTERTIFKLQSQHIIDELLSPIKIGKESNIFTASSKEGTVIVKIYRLQSCNFNKMFEYIKQDQRFLHMKKRRREIIFSWVQREFRNLMKAMDAKVRVPKPIAFVNNVIVMEYIGTEQAALQIKDNLPKQQKKFLDEIIMNLNRLYKAGLVHGDISEFNILNQNDRPVLIDFSQTTLNTSSNADELMKRDIKNLSRFFAKKGLKTSEEKIIASIKK